MLCVHTVAVWLGMSVGLLKVKRVPLVLLLVLGTLFFLLGGSRLLAALHPALIPGFVSTPILLSFHVQLLSLGSLPFSEGKQKSSGSRRQGK